MSRCSNIWQSRSNTLTFSTIQPLIRQNNKNRKQFLTIRPSIRPLGAYLDHTGELLNGFYPVAFTQISARSGAKRKGGCDFRIQISLLSG